MERFYNFIKSNGDIISDDFRKKMTSDTEYILNTFKYEAKIINQYEDTLFDLGNDMFGGIIDGYQSFYLKNSNFFKDTAFSVKSLQKQNPPPNILIESHRPLRICLYRSTVHPGKIMLGSYIKARPASGDLLFDFDNKKSNPNWLGIPLFGICISLSNALDLFPFYGVTALSTQVCNGLVQNWNDHTKGWLARQRISENNIITVSEKPKSSDDLVLDWDFLEKSQAVSLCMEPDVQAKYKSKVNKHGKGKRLSMHFISHNAYKEVKKFLSSERSFGKPVMQSIKVGQGRYAGQPDRLCILTDKCIQLEWFVDDLDAVKSISFCDPVQIVEWYYGSKNEKSFAQRIGDLSTIQLNVLLKAYEYQKSGLGYGLDHAISR